MKKKHETSSYITNGEYLSLQIYKYLDILSNRVEEVITEYDWRECCELMKMLEDKKLVKIEIKWKINLYQLDGLGINDAILI